MLLLGRVFNKAIARTIPLYLADTGSGYARLIGPISQDAKDLAFEEIKEAFESGKVLNKKDMKETEEIVVQNIPHSSETHKVEHYTILFLDRFRQTIKGGHVTRDPSQQTKAK